MAPPQYRARSFSRFALGKDAAALLLGDDGPPRVVPADLAQALETLRTFATMEAHAARAAAALRSPERAAQARRLLDELAVSSELISDQAVARVLEGADGGTDSPCTIRTLVVPTCDRPEALGRALDSFAHHAARRARKVRVVVLDDSRNMAARAANRESIGRVCATHGGAGVYIGLEEKERYAARLASESGVALPLVRFALLGDPACGLTTGANRNAGLLATVDEAALWFDDDVEARFAAPPRRTEGIAFGADGEPSEMRFFADRAAVLANVVREDHDLVALHERWLGRTLPGAARVAGGPVDVRHITPEMLRDVLAHRGRVMISLTGVFGDSAMSTSTSILVALGEHARAELVSSPEVYALAKSSREWLRAAPRPTIAHPYPFMATSFGLDSRGGTPPFLPVMRNADGVFGAVMTRCFEGACAVHLPVAIHHAADPDRLYTDPSAMSRIQLSVLVIAFVASHSFDLGSGGVAERLAILGDRMRCWGETSEREFLAVARSVLLRMMTGSAARMQALIEGPARKVEYWRDDLVRLLEGLWRGVAGDRHPIPVDVEDRVGVDAALAKTQHVGRDYGALLVAWPALVRAEERLRGRGQGLGAEG